MRVPAVLLATTLVIAACGSDGDDNSTATSAAETTIESTTATTTADTSAATTTPATTTPATDAPTTTPTTAAPTTAPPAEITAADLAASGPYEVGVTTRTEPALATESTEGLIEIWYPADEAAAGQVEAYNVRSFLPPPVADLIPPEINDQLEIAAARDGTPAADGPFPVVLFSHGSTAFRTQSSALARHLASWGMAVASTDHPSRSLANALLSATEGQRSSVDDLRAMRTFLEMLPADDPLASALDMGRVGLAGHSAGGGTIAEVATDPGIAGYVSYASGLRDTVPQIPSLFMAGALDAIIEPGRTAEAFEVAPSPSWLWVIENAGHLAFSDLCAIGGDATLIDLAEAAGIGGLVDDGLRSLATDGCEAPNVPVADVWPAVHQASAGFFRWVFDIDAEPIGLDASAVTPNVTVQSK